MGRLKIKKYLKIIFIILLFLLISFFIFEFYCSNKLIYITDNYYLKINNKVSNSILYKKNNRYYLELDNKKIGIDDFIVMYQYNDNYIGVKAINSNKELVYYLIEFSSNYIYGPYDNYEKYLIIQGSFSKEILGDWTYINEL